MEPWIFRFKAEGTVDFSQLTFDPGQNELIVAPAPVDGLISRGDGKRTDDGETSLSGVLRIPACSVCGESLESLSQQEQTAGAEWHCDEFTKGACFSRGKSEEECHHYICELLVNGNRLFTCGTNAFTPICTNRTLTNLTEIHDQISGMARCPYNPRHNSTALITSGGELYAATAMDFSGRDPAIYRSLGGCPPPHRTA
ncbi:hypothetical protein NHX12_021828 [Muraenolepis orangiensis]|uniref:Sema domain-containing protein n=1 Tax=Muraenolepis orangiensis TaxID=630683 RepID=A0A9Q0IVH5_9TELE|nr:hypothetical protein NHX12_021828 [Muraenolepis orangiensis]